MLEGGWEEGEGFEDEGDWGGGGEVDVWVGGCEGGVG